MEHPIDLIRQAAARGREQKARTARVLPFRQTRSLRARVRGAGRRRGAFGGEWRLMVLGGVALGLATVAVDWPAVRVRAPETTGVSRPFGFCHTGGGVNCVVDGDTFWIDGAKVRIADIDTAETHPARCAEEARLGEAATERLQAMLNAGPVVLTGIERDTDRYGRKLRLVEANGVKVGAALVSAGLARPYAGGHRVGWCGP